MLGILIEKIYNLKIVWIFALSETITVTKDQSPKIDTTAEALQKLRPAFIKDGTGTVTAGNSSTINDGAACVLLSTLKEAQKLNIQGEPLARIVSWAQVGIDPAIMGTGPIGAVRKAVGYFFHNRSWSWSALELVIIILPCYTFYCASSHTLQYF